MSPHRCSAARRTVSAASDSAPPCYPLQRLLDYARVYRRQIWAATLCSLMDKLCDLAPPTLIGVAVDVVVQQQDSVLARFGVTSVAAQLGLLTAISVVIWAFELIFEYAYARLWRNLAQTIQHDLRLAVYSHLQSLEMEYFESNSTGRLMSIVNDDINQPERFLDYGANEVLQVAATVVLIGGAYFILAPGVAWLVMLPMPFISAGMGYISRHGKPKPPRFSRGIQATQGALAPCSLNYSCLELRCISG